MSIRLLARLADPAAAVTPDAELLRRFAQARDESAFELLVWRHAGLVLGTCRRVLGRAPDADDAFQATFLALARKAGQVRGPHLPGWLHRVAHRAAVRVRARADRALPDPEALARVAAREVPLPDDTAAVLDEEIARLPDKLRIAFVLCALDGRTDADAAAALGCPVGTVQSRLSRARERLRARLTRRGFAVAALGAFAGPVPVASADLVAATVRGAVPFATGLPAEGAGVPGAVANGVLRAMAADGLKRAAAVALLVVAAGVALAAATPTGVPVPPPALTQPTAAPVPKPAPTNFTLALADKGVGWVADLTFSPDGKWLLTTGQNVDGATSVDVWDAATGRHAHAFLEPGPRPASREGAATAFSPDGKTLAVTFRTRRPTDGITLWAVGTWAPRAVLPDTEVTVLRFSSDSKLLVASTSYNTGPGDSRVWDAARGTLIHEQPGSERGEGGRALFYTPVFSPDGTTVLIPARQAPTRVFEATGKLRFGFTSSSQRSTYSPDGQALAAHTSDERGVQVIDATTGKVRFVVPAPAGDKPSIVRFSPDSTALLVASWHLVPGTNGFGEPVTTVRLHDAATGRPVRTFEPEVRRLESLQFSPDGRWVAGESKTPSRPFVWDSDVWVWNTHTGARTPLFGRSTITRRLDSSARVEGVRFSPDGKVVAVSAVETRGNEHGSAAREELVREEVRQVSYLSDPWTERRVTLPGVRRVVFGPAGTAALISGPLDAARGRLKQERDEVTVRDLADLMREAR